MKRNFLTTKELAAFKLWVADNGLYWEEDKNDRNVFDIKDGRFNLYIEKTSEEGLYEVFDDSERNTAAGLLQDFNYHKIYLLGIEVPKKKIEKFVPEDLKPYLKEFDHFRMCLRPDKLWNLLGAVGFYTERLAICNYKLPLKVLGSNFHETYWTLIYVNKKEKRNMYADNQEYDRNS